MNTQVTATGMQVRAVAEDGLLIINEQDADTAGNWKVTTQATFNTAADLAPTSTSDVTVWYHNKSDDPTTAKANQASDTYETLSGTKWLRDTNGAYYFDADGENDKDAGEKYYTLLNKFYIKSSGAQINLGTGNTYQALYINKIKTTSDATDSANLDKSLRIAIKVKDNLYIYAPFYTANVNYTVAGTTSTTATFVPSNTVLNQALPVTGTTKIDAIPAIGTAKAGTIPVEIYLYFEGEDTNCKSENITATLDTLTVEVTFGITTVSST